MNKKKKEPQHIDMNLLRLHTPNKIHLQACIRGGNVHRNKKAYTRKQKHPASW